MFNTDRMLQFWDRVHATDPLLRNTPERWDDELVLTQEQVEAALAQTLGPLWTPELQSLLIERMGDQQLLDREETGEPTVSLQKAAIAEAIIRTIPWLEDPSQRKISGALLRVFRKPDPQKGGRAAALKRWEKLRAEGVDFKEYMAKVSAAKRPIEERRKDGSLAAQMAKARAAKKPIEERRKDGSLAAQMAKARAAKRPIEERRKDGSFVAHMAKLQAGHKNKIEKMRQDGSLAVHMANMRVVRKAKAESRKSAAQVVQTDNPPELSQTPVVTRIVEQPHPPASGTQIDSKKTEK